jgi:hypothetical protein
LTNQLIFPDFTLLLVSQLTGGGSTDGVSSLRFLTSSNSLSRFLSLSTVFFFFSFFFAAIRSATVITLALFL